MIVEDPIDRFETNFGVNPNSINLAPVWTSPFSATNVEMSGESFDSEDDFGDGMTGINGGLGSFFSDLAQKIDNLRFGAASSGRSSSSHGVFPVEQRSMKEWGTPTAQAHAAQRAQIVSTGHPMQGSQPTVPAVQFKPPVNWTQIGWGYGPGSGIEFVSDRPIMGAHVTSKGVSGFPSLF